MSSSRPNIIAPFFAISLLLLSGALFLAYPILSQPKYTISFYHFNPQYIAGDKEAENNVIKEALYGLLKIYERHPRWKFTLEISGLGIEMMLENHTDVLELLRELVNRGQCELIVTHYSDQLWVAYPRDDLVRSINISQQLLEKAGLKSAKIAMFQEGQWGPGLVLLSDYGFTATLISEDTLLYYGYQPHYPVLRWNFFDKEINLVVYTDGIRSMNGITWVWRWISDGELAITKGSSTKFEFDEEIAKIHEDRMKVFEAQGWKFITISEWLEIAKENGLVGILDEYIPESTWLMFRCYGVFRWMGYHSSYREDDGYIRAINSRARLYVVAAQTLIDNFNDIVSPNIKAELEEKIGRAWKYLFLAEVSDSTGWNPRQVEINYSIYYSERAINVSKEISEFFLDKLGVKYIQVFPYNDTIIATNDTEELLRVKVIEDTNTPLNILVNGTSADISTQLVEFLGYSLYRIRIDVNPSDKFNISIVGNFSRVIVSPTLYEDKTVQLNLSDYKIKGFWIPVSNGLIMTEEFAIIRNNSARYIAFHMSDHCISFIETNQEARVMYELYVMINPSIDKALFIANSINLGAPILFTR